MIITNKINSEQEDEWSVATKLNHGDAVGKHNHRRLTE